MKQTEQQKEEEKTQQQENERKLNVLKVLLVKTSAR